MIKLALSNLENARQNPSLVAKTMYESNSKGGGSRGFVSTFKSEARKYHEKELTIDDACKSLDHRLWVSFKESPINNLRRQTFLESLKEYASNHSLYDLTIEKFQVNLNWDFVPNVKLTGQSPFLCSNDKFNIAYYFKESGGNWRGELKYPLLQIYLADNFFKCTVDNIKIGVYDIAAKQFDLYTYEDFELDNALIEGKSVLNNVLAEYNKYSK